MRGASSGRCVSCAATVARVKGERPKEIGGYRILATLGRGGMGAVYRARDADGRMVALKLLHAHLDDPETRERLRREVAALQKVRHAGVARVLDAEIESAEAFIVTELQAGTDLGRHVRREGPLAPRELAELAARLREALAVVHDAGVLHRDLTPGNVMVTPDGPVLIDFGVAQVIEDARVTAAGLVTGTPGYVAPELLEGVDPSVATDWWGWAAVLTFAATGKPPFGRGGIAAVLTRVRAGKPALAGLDERVADVLRRSLAVDPADRPAPEDVVAGLEAAADEIEAEEAEADAAAAGEADGADGEDAPGEDEADDEGAGEEADEDATTVLGDDDATAVLADGADPGDQDDDAPDEGAEDDQGDEDDLAATAVVAPTATRVLPADPGAPEEPAWEDEGADAGDWSDEGEWDEASGEWDGEWEGAEGDWDGAEEWAGEGEEWPAEPDPAWAAALYAAPPRRTGTVAALALPLLALGVARPGAAIAVALVLAVLVRSVGLDLQGLARRRARRGPRATDRTTAVLTWPWYLVRAVLGVLPAVLVGGAVLVMVGGVIWWLAGADHLVVAAPGPGEAAGVLPGNAEWVGRVAVALMAALGLVMVWFGPTSRTTRDGARHVLEVVAPRPTGALVAVVVAVAAAAVLSQVMSAQEVVWWPLGGPPDLG